MDEGLANYMAGYWNVLDLMQVRDAALTDNVPKMSEFETQPLSGRLPYSLGHATFEFIEARWGKEGLRQFLFSLRKSVIGGGESAYEEALKLKPEEFDEQFDRYLKERFKPFRDKERPADYGRNLAPNPERTPYVAVLSIEPSPIGDMLAAVVGNRRDQELDIILISAQGRPGHPQPDEGLRQGPRLRVHRDGRRPARQPRAVDRVGADRRPHRVLRAHREEQDAHHPERRHGQDRCGASS